ncbi:hypothetical protein C2S51_021349 [Perilla frutescens var. frutescens]|nr:hypothetical protein C2S51_021349 [Perilla frutescens var. frutescens]
MPVHVVPTRRQVESSRQRNEGKAATVHSIFSPVQAQKTNKCTLPTQALSCSGAKGLSQPDLVRAPATMASAGLDADTPGAFSHQSTDKRNKCRT